MAIDRHNPARRAEKLRMQRLPFAIFGAWFTLSLSKNAVLALVERGSDLFWVGDAIFYVFFPFVLALPLLNSRDRWADFGLHPIRNADIGRAMFASALLFAVYIFTLQLAYRFFYSPDTLQWNYGEILPKMALAKFAFAIYLSLTAALAEEFYFRGVLSSLIKNGRIYVATSAITFGVAHWAHGAYNVVAATVYGAVAAALYRTFGSRLSPLVAAHFVIGMYWFS